MSLLPTIRTIVPASYVATDVLSAFHADINTNSAKFNIGIVAAGGIADGFTVESVADPGIQYCFRRTGAATINLSVEPTGSITAVGTTAAPPTGTSADWSGEKTWTIGASIKIAIAELADAFFVMMKNSGGTYWDQSVHIGRVYVPTFPAIDEPRGRDGLGLLIGHPCMQNNTPSTYWSGSSSTQSLIHIATNIWQNPNTTYTATTNITNGANVAFWGFIHAFPIPVQRSGVNFCDIGRFKYLFQLEDRFPPLSVRDYDAGTDQAFVLGSYGSTSDNSLGIVWDKTVPV